MRSILSVRSRLLRSRKRDAIAEGLEIPGYSYKARPCGLIPSISPQGLRSTSPGFPIRGRFMRLTGQLSRHRGLS
jgi:hypothetical protein